MSQDQKLTEAEKEFVKQTRKHMDEKGTEFVNQYLKPIIVSHDLPILDTYYIMQRVKDIFNEKFKRINFENEQILKLRKELFDKVIHEAKTKKARKPDKGEREERCEPVCRKIVDELLSGSWLLSDEKYLPNAVKNDDELLIRILVNGYVDNIANWLEVMLKENKRRSDDELYGKEDIDITWKDLDKILGK